MPHSVRSLFSPRCPAENQSNQLVHTEVFAAADSLREWGLANTMARVSRECLCRRTFGHRGHKVRGDLGPGVFPEVSEPWPGPAIKTRGQEVTEPTPYEFVFPTPSHLHQRLSAPPVSCRRSGPNWVDFFFFFFFNVMRLHSSRAQRNRAGPGGLGDECCNLGTPRVYTARPPACHFPTEDRGAYHGHVLGPGRGQVSLSPFAELVTLSSRSGALLPSFLAWALEGALRQARGCATGPLWGEAGQVSGRGVFGEAGWHECCRFWNPAAWFPIP